MPPKKKRFESRFPPVSHVNITMAKGLNESLLFATIYSPFSARISIQARIKKIMQLDDDVGKVAASVPLIICILIT